jgi:orotate phosphoribosyltransferase
VTEPTALERLLLARSVQRGDFVLASGRHSSYYIDCRITTMSAEGLTLIGRAGLEAMREKDWRPRGVGGLTMGADPVAYAIAAASFGSPAQVDAFSVRKDVKQHGTRRSIEGNFKPGDAVVVVEDVITSGGSALQAIGALRENGARIIGVLAVVDREQGGAGKIAEAGYEVVCLTTSSSLGLSDL